MGWPFSRKRLYDDDFYESIARRVREQRYISLGFTDNEVEISELTNKLRDAIGNDNRKPAKWKEGRYKMWDAAILADAVTGVGVAISNGRIVIHSYITKLISEVRIEGFEVAQLAAEVIFTALTGRSVEPCTIDIETLTITGRG